MVYAVSLASFTLELVYQCMYSILAFLMTLISKMLYKELNMESIIVRIVYNYYVINFYRNYQNQKYFVIIYKLDENGLMNISPDTIWSKFEPADNPSWEGY